MDNRFIAGAKTGELCFINC